MCVGAMALIKIESLINDTLIQTKLRLNWQLKKKLVCKS